MDKLKAYYYNDPHAKERDEGRPVIIVGNHHKLMIYYFLKYKYSYLYMGSIDHFKILPEENE